MAQPRVKDMIGLDGVKMYRFYCPGCRSHHAPIEGRWTFNGDYERPTFSPSILVSAPYMGDVEPYVCHSFVTDGRIQYLGDCTHGLAGQTIELPSID